MSSPDVTGETAKRRDEVVDAWRIADTAVGWWLCVSFFFILFFALVLLPWSDGGAHPHHGQGHGQGHGHGHHSHSSIPYSYGYYPYYNYARADKGLHTSAVGAAVHLSKAQREPRVPSDTVKEWLGTSKGHDVCDNDAERVHLRAVAAQASHSSAEPDLSEWRPSAHVLLDEQAGEIEFVVEAPYVAADGAFVATFEDVSDNNLGAAWARGDDFLHKPGTCQSSAPMTASNKGVTQAHQEELWAHAPSALYDGAFSRSALRRGANGWRPHPISCSRFSMHMRSTAQHLAQCVNSDGRTAPVAFAATQDAVSVSGTLWLHFVRPTRSRSSSSSNNNGGNDDDDTPSIEAYSWPFSFTITIDQYESKVTITDVPDADLRRDNPSHSAVAAKKRGGGGGGDDDAFNLEAHMRAIEAGKLLSAVDDDILSDSEVRNPHESVAAHSQRDLLLSLHASQRLKWITHSSLLQTWFSPAGDERVFGGKSALQETELQKTRAMRLQFESTSVTSVRSFVEATSNLALSDDALLAHIAKSAPTFRIVALEALFKIAAERDADDAGSGVAFDDESSDNYLSFGRFRLAEADFVPQSWRLGAPTCRTLKGTRTSVTELTHVACTRNFTLVLLPRSHELYEGAFEVKLCNNNNNKQCGAKTPDHRVRFDLAITDPSADMQDVKALQTEITSHLNTAATHQIHEDAFEGGDRVCMQTYAVGPPALMQSIDVRTIAAWLCVDDDKQVNRDPTEYAHAPHNPRRIELEKLRDSLGPSSSSSSSSSSKKKGKKSKASRISTRAAYLSTQASATSGCLARHHHIQLYGTPPADSPLNKYTLQKARNISVQVYQPTVHEPGAYGSWSSALCFNASTVFVDERGNSVHRTRYYFQSEVAILPTEKRRHNHATQLGDDGAPQFNHRTFGLFERAARSDSARLDEHVERIARDVRTPPAQLTSEQLGKMLGKLDATQHLDRFHTAKFNVKVGTSRTERYLYHHSTGADIWVVLVVVVLAFVFACCCLGLLYQRRRTINST